jgi:hypothetical protein
MKLLGIVTTGFDISDQILINFLHLPDIGEKKWESSEAVHQLFMDFKKAYNSVRGEVLYSILIEFGVPVKLAGMIKMCLNEV